MTTDDDFEASLDAARAVLAGHVAGDPEHEDLWEANEAVNEALAERPTHVDAWLLKSQVLSSLGDDFAALAAVEMALRSDPTAEAHYVKAGVLFDLGRYADAETAISSAFSALRPPKRGKRAPGDRSADEWLLDELYYEKALIQEALGRPADAARTFEEGLAACPWSELLKLGFEPLRKERTRRTLKLIPGGKKG